MILSVLEGVLACAYAELTPAPAWQAVVPGLEAVLDECCSGQVWVRLVQMQPRSNRDCITAWDATVEVGVARCVAVVDDQGNSPTSAEVQADAAQLLADMEALQRALECCAKTVPNVHRAIIGTWNPLAVDGGCAGGTWNATVTVPDCAC